MELGSKMWAWYNSKSQPVKFVVTTVVLVIAGVLVIGLLSVTLLRNASYPMSNGLFFAGALLFTASLVAYFTHKGAPLPELENQPKDALPDTRRMAARVRRRAEIPFWAAVLFLAGIILFGLSIVFGSASETPAASGSSGAGSWLASGPPGFHVEYHANTAQIDPLAGQSMDMS
jgi:O-antigen ligase